MSRGRAAQLEDRLLARKASKPQGWSGPNAGGRRTPAQGGRGDWPGATVVDPKAYVQPPPVKDRITATVGSQGPDKLTRDYGARMAKRWSKETGQPYDPTYRKTPTPSGGTRYKLVGPNGRTRTTPLSA
jgi:hypothetical protein